MYDYIPKYKKLTIRKYQTFENVTNINQLELYRIPQEENY